MTGQDPVAARAEISWDDRKTVAEVYQAAGGVLADLSDSTYDALLAVARWGAEAGAERAG